MILGVDHVALSTEDVRAASRSLAAAGYSVKFVQSGLPNSPAKKPYLQTYEPLHAVAYCTSPAGVAIEATCHATELAPAVSSYQVLLGGALPNAGAFTGTDRAWASVWRDAYGCRRAEPRYWADVHAQVWSDVESPSACGVVRAVLVPVADLERSEAFWCGGLTATKVASGSTAEGCRWAKVAVASPVPSWSLSLVLAESTRRPRPFLDSSGFPCLALLSTSVSRDADRLGGLGAIDPADPFDITVNGRRLAVTLLRGPDAEIVELLEVRR